MVKSQHAGSLLQAHLVWETVPPPGSSCMRQDCALQSPRFPSILVMESYSLYERNFTMTRLNVSKAREEFPELGNRAAYGKERTIVSRRGKDLAAVIPIEDLRLLERLAREEMDRIDLEDARAALAEAKEKGTIPLRDLMRILGD